MPLNLGGNELNSLGVKLLNDTNLINTNLYNLWDFGLPSSYTETGTVLNTFTTTGMYWNLTNGPTYSTLGGGSLLFDGSNDYLAYGNAAFWSLGTPFTVNFWIRTTGAGQMGLMSHYSGGPVNSGMFVDSGKLGYAYYNGDWRYNFSDGSNVNTGNWVMVTYASPSASNGTIVTYVNGVSDWSFTVTGGHFGSNIGSIGILWGFSYFNGRIAHVSHYTVQHSASQVLQNFNATRQRFGV
jgi:hypothetical protein